MMKVLVLVKGKSLNVPSHYCDKITVEGDIDSIFIINQDFNRTIRPVKAKRSVSFLGKGLELITRSDSIVVLDGDVETYLIRDGEYVTVVHPLTDNDFK